MPEKRAPMACNACSPVRCGTRTGYVMTCVATRLVQLGQESAILAIDETSFLKQGHHSAGVGWL